MANMNKQQQQAYEMWRDGESYADIAKKKKVSIATAKSWYQRYKWKELKEQEEGMQKDADQPEVCDKVEDGMQSGRQEQGARLSNTSPDTIIETVSAEQARLVKTGELFLYDADNLPEIEDKQARFVKEFCIDLNGRQAAIRAGYPISNADYMASTLRHNPKVSAHIEAALAAADRRTGMNIDRARKELAKIALANPAKVVANDGSILSTASDEDLAAIQSIKVKCVGINKETGEELYEREVRFHDKNKAIELYGRMSQWLVERKEITVQGDISNLSTAELEVELQRQQQLANTINVTPICTHTIDNDKDE